jgi:hypothetical protein
MPPEQVRPAAPVHFPRGVADPAGRVGYVADGTRVVAVDLVAGRPLWRSDDAGRPLIADGERLAAARPGERVPNVLAIVVLDATREGRTVLVSDPVRFPEWVTVATERRAKFRLRARLQGDLLRLEWEAHARYAGGAPPPPDVSQAAAQDGSGAVEVDLGTGVVTPAGVDAEPSPPREPPLDDDEFD